MNDEKEKIEVDIQYKLKGDLNIQEEIPVDIPEVIDEENSPSVDYGDYESSSNNGVVDNTSNNDIVENSSDNEMENESTSSDDLNGELDEDSNNAEDTSNDQDNNEDTSNDQDNNEDTSNDQDYNEDTSNDRNSIEDTSNDRNSNVDASNDQYTLINTYYNNDVSESPNRNKYSNEENYNEVSNLYQTVSNKPKEENPDNNHNNNKQDDNQYNRENYYPNKGENNNQYNRQNNVNSYNNNDTINNSFNNVVAYKKINNNGGYNKILVNKLGINNNSNYETDIPVDISGAIEVEDSSSINYESSLDKGAVDNKSINGTVEIEDSSSNEMEIEIESTSSDEADQISNGELEEDSNNTEDTSNNQNGSEDTSSNQSSEDTSSDQSSEDTSTDQSSEDTSSDQSSSEDTIPDNEHQNTPNNNNDGNESSNENKDPNEGNNNEDPNQNQAPSNKPKEENSDNNHNNHEQNDNQDKGNNHDPNNGQNNINNHNHNNNNNNNNNNANNSNGLNRGPHNNNKNNNSAINNAAAHKQGGSDGGAGKTLGDKLGSNKKGSFSDRMKDRFDKKKKDKDKDKDKDDNDNNDDDDSNEKSKRKIALALKIKIIIVLVVILAIAALLIILIAAIVSLFSWLIGLFHLFDDPGSGTDTPAIVETSPIYQDYKLFEDSIVEAIEKYQSSCGVAIDKYYIIGTLTYKYTDELEALSDGSAYREMAKYANTVADLMVSDCVVDLAEDGLYYNKLLQSSFFSSYFKKQIDLAGGDKNIVLDAIFEYIDSGKEAKKFMRGSLDINLPVNLLSCADDATSTKKLNEGRGYESTVDLSYYMEGVIFGEVGGHIEEKNKEGLKALIVAATTFVLKRNNYNSNTTELTIRSGDCNQVYCDPEIGCNYVSKDNGKYGTGYTGTQGSGSVHKPISAERKAVLEEAMDEVFGTVMLDSSGSLMSIQYRDKMSTCGTTSNCLGQIEAFNYSQQGMGYEQILQKFYSGFQLSEVVGDYTEGVQYGEGKFQTIGGFKYYNQGDYHQKFCGRSGATISGSGCGVTSMAMVIANMVDPSITPVQTMNEAHSMGYCGPGISGTSAGYFKKAAAKRGLSYNAVSRGGNTQSVINALKSGNSLVIAHMGPGMWTSGGHYIVLAGVNSKGQVLVYDPASRNRTGKYYDFNSKIVSQLKGQLHIITKK